MNYLAHAYLHLDSPYFAAGTALPDWMSIVDRKNRPRRQYALPVITHADPRIAATASGCVQHHADDDRFHQQPAFVTLSTQFAVGLRSLLPAGMGHQAGFVGHISVELLLDAVLIERDPRLLDAYYRTLAEVDPHVVQQAANTICRRPVTRLVELLPRFIDARFLASYSHDRTLLASLNGVMSRVALPPLPDSLIDWLGEARRQVRTAADQLLAPG